MKKVFALFLMIVVLMSGLTACGTSAPAPENDGKSEEITTYKVGICNYVDDASLNQIVDNLQQAITDISLNQAPVEVLVENCNADSGVLAQIIQNFLAEEVDVMVAVATPVAMAMQAATEGTDVPVVFAAVSDPLGAGLVQSLEKPGSNLTGTSDYLDTEAMIRLILGIQPEIQKVGLLYDLGQDSSKAPIEQAEALLTDEGVEVVHATGTNVDEIRLAASSLISQGVEAVFTPSDNTVMTAELSIYEDFANAGVLHYAGADSFALNGAFLGYGVDYANLGRETGAMVCEILFEGKNPAEMPVRTFDNGTATINTDICAIVGKDYDRLASELSPYCTHVQEIQTAESFDD